MNLPFTKYLWGVKLFKLTWGTFWKNSYLITCRGFDLWRHLLTSFCSISLIFPLNRLFEQLILIFTKYQWGVKLFNKTWGAFGQNLCLIPCHGFNLWRHFALFHWYYHFITFSSNLGWFLRNVFTCKVVQHDQRKILAKYFLMLCLVCDLWRHLWTSYSFVSLILLLHRLFQQLNLIFTKYLWGVKMFNMTSSW